MYKRKKRVIDGTDREILRVLLLKRPLVTMHIAKYIGLSSQCAKIRLCSLADKGIVKKSKTCGIRRYRRNFRGRQCIINSPQKIYWDLDLEEEK
jgi:predicted ArsR family transcriptional regulator